MTSEIDELILNDEGYSLNNSKFRIACFLFTIIYFFSGVVAPVFAAVSYSYDANGNMTSDGQNCYTYNDANQLAKVTNCASSQTVAEYVYDYQGNRIEKKVYSSGSLQKTVYSPNKTYETVKQASSGGTATTGIWTTGSASGWAAAIVSFNSAGSTPALVQKNKGFGGGTGSVATSFTSNVTAGHAIVVMTITASASNLDTTSVTDNQSNTYTQIGTTQHTPGNAYLRLWYAKNVTGGSVTVTAHQSGSASGCLMEILEYSGLSTTAPADQSASTTGNSTSPSGGSITPTNNNALIISAFTDDNADSVSISGTSGYTVEESDLINSTSTRNGIEDKVQTTGGATTNTSYYIVNDSVVAKKNPDGSKTYYLSDNLGSTSVLTNQSGTVIENSTYYPFGQIRSGGTQTKQLYTGQENDSETNLDYYNARYYNPGDMHFTQPDDQLPNAYDPQQLNRYAYVRNNPMTINDPTGHCGAFCVPLITGAIGAIVGVGFQYLQNPKSTLSDYAKAGTVGFVSGFAAPVIETEAAGVTLTTLAKTTLPDTANSIISHTVGVGTASVATTTFQNVVYGNDPRQDWGTSFGKDMLINEFTDGTIPMQGRVPSIIHPTTLGANSIKQIQREGVGTLLDHSFDLGSNNPNDINFNSPIHLNNNYNFNYNYQNMGQTYLDPYNN